MTTTVWLLGASDPEMELIGRLLRAADERVVPAQGPTGARGGPDGAHARAPPPLRRRRRRLGAGSGPRSAPRARVRSRTCVRTSARRAAHASLGACTGRSPSGVAPAASPAG